jgi:hypothetical protein
MEYFVDTEKISLDYSEERIMNDLPAYRLTIYDKFGHFDAEVYLFDEQIKDLIDGLDKIKQKQN